MTRLLRQSSGCLLLVTMLGILPGCASTGRSPYGNLVGEWDMKTNLRGGYIDATMELAVEDGKLVGVWESQGMEMKMHDLAVDGDRLTFKRTIGDSTDLLFEGKVDGDRISGKYSGPFGELDCTGERTKKE